MSPEPEPLVTPERARLAEAVRHIIDAVLICDDATEEQLRGAADAAEQIATDLGRSPHADDRGPDHTPPAHRFRAARDHTEYLPRSPLVGQVSPLAPPLEWEVVDSRIEARGRYHAAYEGPPGYVHGGWVALTFDEILGMANIASGHPAMTGTLKVRYLLPTPLHTDVRLVGWTERIEGRRVVAKGELHVGDQLTAEAEGLFVTIDEKTAAAYFGAARGEAAPAGVTDEG